jgi:hypothetical protein
MAVATQGDQAKCPADRVPSVVRRLPPSSHPGGEWRSVAAGLCTPESSQTDRRGSP